MRAGFGLKLIFIGIVPVLFPARVIPAQTATVTGSIVDSAGHPIVGAEVTAPVFGTSVISGERGEFRMVGLPSGPILLKAKRLGFRPDSVLLRIAGDQPPAVKLRLVPVATEIKPVVVRTNRMEYRGRLSGYYERLDRRNSGYFITRAQIDAENPRTLTQLLQRAPGMSQFRGRGGLSGVRMRGRNCWPLVWLDGTQMPSGDVDLDGIPPSTLHGIELYLGATTAPVRYTAGRDFSSCGTILLWSRGPDTDPLPPRQGPAWNLEALVASMQVFMPDQVDRQAEPDPARPFQVEYPAALFAEKIEGRVDAEFVVGTNGRIEDETFGVVSSTHRLFTDAVRIALQGASYRVATRDGKRVRQLVHQSFNFIPAGRRSSNPGPDK